MINLNRLRKSGAGQRGFTLLLAALVSSIVLSLGASIFLVAKKELTLSSLGRDSQYAFYAADEAGECALYWDARWGYFGTSTPPGLNLQTVKCDGQCLASASGSCIDVPGRYSGTYPYTMTFQYNPTSAGTSYCADVSVEKCDGTIAVDGTCTHAVPAVIHTTIHANGYSTSCATLTTNPRALQRSVELHY